MIETRIQKIFATVLELSRDFDFATLRYNEHPDWTSVAHMSIVAGLEMEFDIIMETDDILAMSDYAKAVEIIARYSADN
jgi:acyl carrier protein